MSRRTPHRLVAVLLASAVLLVGAALPAAAAPAALPDPGDAALDWIEGELASEGGALSTAYDDGMGGVGTFPDWGLTIDAILALAADGRGAQAPATTASGLVEDNVADYITGGAFGPDDRYAGATAKTLLMAQIQGEDPTDFGGFDLEAELRARVQTTGSDAGRFSDLTGFGDFSNGFGQALAIMALARTADGAPDAAVDFLLAQQCPNGKFRGDYTTPGGCQSNAEATFDATGFALQALIAIEPTCATGAAIDDAVATLTFYQDRGGAFGGDESGFNTNSTGLAAVALRSLGREEAADRAAGFIADLQLEVGDDLGAISLNAAGEAAAADGIQPLERDGFRRAATQGVFAFDLPAYAEIGRSPIDPNEFHGCPHVDVFPGASLSASSALAGDDLTVTGFGFTPGETVDATLHSTPVDLGSVTAGPGGKVSLTFTVPSDLEPGEHRVELVGRESGVTVSAEFEVLGVEAPRTLPVTGRTMGAQAAAGIGLVALGAALLVAARRRSRHLGTVRV